MNLRKIANINVGQNGIIIRQTSACLENLREKTIRVTIKVRIIIEKSAKIQKFHCFENIWRKKKRGTKVPSITSIFVHFWKDNCVASSTTHALIVHNLFRFHRFLSLIHFSLAKPFHRWHAKHNDANRESVLEVHWKIPMIWLPFP